MQNAVRGAMGIEPFYLTCAKMDTPDGTPIRDYINVVDLNEAHLAAIEHLLRGGSSEVINLGSGTGNSVLEIVNEVQKVTGKTFDLKTTEARKGEATKMIASIEKAKRVLNWEPKRTLEQSVKSLVTWYTAHPHGWER
jgi:UDP-glucose 4-epimerase